MQVIETEIPDVKVLVPKKFGDHRGFFSEVYSRKALAAVGITAEFVQDRLASIPTVEKTRRKRDSA